MRRFFFLATIIVSCVILIVVLETDLSKPPHKLVLEKLEALAEPRQVTLLFAGDVMLGRNVGHLIAAHGSDFPFAKIATATSALAPDLFMANLEGPITSINTDATNSMRFQFDPAVIATLVHERFTHLSVANNHEFDQGHAGSDDTITALSTHGITPVGAPNGTALGTIASTMINGRTIVLIGLDTTITPHDRDALAAELRTVPTDAFIVAYVHWGDEYQSVHSAAQQDFAHFLIDNGVDLVLGSHPHVLEDVETYADRAIFYSLGNFVFDQYWNHEVQTGQLVKAVLDGDTVTYTPIIIESIHSQPHIKEGTTTPFSLPID